MPICWIRLWIRYGWKRRSGKLKNLTTAGCLSFRCRIPIKINWQFLTCLRNFWSFRPERMILLWNRRISGSMRILYQRSRLIFSITENLIDVITTGSRSWNLSFWWSFWIPWTEKLFIYSTVLYCMCLWQWSRGCASFYGCIGSRHMSVIMSCTPISFLLTSQKGSANV